MTDRIPTYRFERYALIPATENDAELAAEWIQADRFHTGLAPQYWTLQAPGINSFRLEDSEGTVFFFRMQLTTTAREIKVYIQFAPESAVSRERTKDGMVRGMAWLQQILLESGFDRLLFQSKNPSLVLFAKRRLKFNVFRNDDCYTLVKEF